MARAPAPADLDPESGHARLSYERAEYLFKTATNPSTRSGAGTPSTSYGTPR